MVLSRLRYSSRLEELYKTVWEMSIDIDMSRHRYFVDQSQSLNLFMQNAIIQN
jgi:hypothetical protein